MQTKPKRILSGAAALLVAVALAVGGTFAYRAGERKSNVMQGKAQYQARLVEHFPPGQPWEKDQEITKQVSVKNMGYNNPDKPGERWGDIYVRVQILEYMDITKVNYLYYAGPGNAPIPMTNPGHSPEPIPLMITKAGDFVRLTSEQYGTLTGNTAAVLKGQLEAVYDWTKVIEDHVKRSEFLQALAEDMVRAGGRDFEQINGTLFPEDNGFYYLPTQAGDPNGQYGAYLAMGKVAESPVVVAGKERVDYELGNHNDYMTNYEIHMWDGATAETCGLATHDYADFVLGDGVWIMRDTWLAGGARMNGKTLAPKEEGPFWILDPATGWATWGQAIPAAPKNNETAKLLEAIMPKVDLEDEIYYDIYVHMEAYSKSDMPSDFLLYVPPAAPVAPNNISPSSLPGGTTGTPYSQTLSASGTKPMTWSLASGTLPAGLTLNANGTITGTPTAPGTFNFVVEATNAGGSATQPLSIVVTAATVAPVITTTSLPGGTTGTPYSQPLAATGTAPITWAITSGSLPAGLTLSANGTISGTPTAAGTANFVVEATNAAGSVTKPLSIVVTAAAVAPVITTTSLPGGTTGTPYSQLLAATGTAPITWAITSGSLPAGLTLSADGTIAGTPTAAGTANFVVEATNAAGSVTKPLSIAITAATVAPVITTASLPVGEVDSPYSYALAATGTAPITWSLTGTLPAGLTLNTTTGLISGTPTAAGTANFTITASNSAGNSSKVFSIEVTTDRLPTCNGEGPYEPEYSYDSGTDTLIDFTKFIVLDWDGSIDTTQVGQHDGSIPLKDILTEGPYDNTVTLTILDSAKFTSSDIKIAQDPRNGNEWCIVYTYYPKTSAEMDAVGTWTTGNTIGGYDSNFGYNPTVKTKVRLTRNGQSADVWIQMRFNDSYFPW